MLKNANSIRTQLIKILHAFALGGHSGERNCWQRTKTLFHWSEMKQDVIAFVQYCDVCQRNKSENIPYPKLLQPIPVPKQAWSHISTNFMEKLPKSESYLAWIQTCAWPYLDSVVPTASHMLQERNRPIALRSI